MTQCSGTSLRFFPHPVLSATLQPSNPTKGSWPPSEDLFLKASSPLHRGGRGGGLWSIHRQGGLSAPLGSHGDVVVRRVGSEACHLGQADVTAALPQLQQVQACVEAGTDQVGMVTRRQGDQRARPIQHQGP